MALTTFHPFPRLPAELRRQIYLETTQPRFVHIQAKSLAELTEQDEDDDLSDFEAFTAHLAPWNLSLDPSLVYFAHDWRNRIRTSEPPRSAWRFRPRDPDRTIQTRLTSYGFSTTRRARQPWPPTRQYPEVLPHILCAQPRAAWQMTRLHALYSAAPIPPLLHTCAESRLVLVQHGYELAFRTRSAGPRTWFCFGTDVLYLPKLPCNWNDPDADADETGAWDLHPDDLARVRRLALENLDLGVHRSEASSALRLCPNVQQLFAVDRLACRKTRSWLLSGTWGCAAPPTREGGWEWIDCDEADALSYPSLQLGGEPIRGIGLHSVGCEALDLWQWKRMHRGDSTGFFEDYANTIKARLREELERVMREEGGGVKPWNIPTVRLVVVGMPSTIEEVFKARDRYWVAIQARERQEQERGVSPSDYA
ncbi:hypothetical protein B0H67DRAFT_603439 [Lasiosphaeris hirsuta]|uniref:2EXR domain-containing protein n=1 Tax=Lasiosphaeris hirsuta TaxID=260670 RepID=A0AA40DMD3_9PEZI|nr:hypothetical protein B0H67DRAFT_603439 [Lasiosphaeris hirsuta]